MMAKLERVMIFIDGTWLWHNMMSLKRKIDLSKLPCEIISHIEKKNKIRIKLKEVILCASSPENVDSRDECLIQKRSKFFNMLQEKCGYTLEIYNIDFRGNRILKKDRNPNDFWKPKEKCVDIAVTSNLLYYAAINGYDRAVVITGDKDFDPAFIKVLNLGKKITIASFRNSCSQQLNRYEPIFIDDFINRILLE
jgi:uncharacterized LabA/DUF88 family protein